MAGPETSSSFDKICIPKNPYVTDKRTANPTKASPTAGICVLTHTVQMAILLAAKQPRKISVIMAPIEDSSI